eukprot:1309484-Rhodomonas_salina.1
MLLPGTAPTNLRRFWKEQKTSLQVPPETKAISTFCTRNAFDFAEYRGARVPAYPVLACFVPGYCKDMRWDSRRRKCTVQY